MTDWNRTLQADYDLSPALIDNNAKLLWDAAVKDAPEGDLFGSALDTVNWTETDYNEIGDITVYPKEGASLLESSGVLTNVSGTPSTAWSLGAKREFSYGDCDIVFEWEDTENQVGPSLCARVYNFLHLNSMNYVFMYHRSRRFSGAYNELMVYKRINGVSTQLYYIYFSGLSAKVRFRFKRVAATNTFTFYTATWNGSSWNAWVQRWSGVIYHATYFNYTHQLFPVNSIMHLAADPTAFTPELGAYFQKTDDGIAAQRFWPDSPECHVIDSAVGAVEYVVDIGPGNTFFGSGFTCTQTEPGTSTVKFKIGYGDTADRASATFDTTWRTEGELSVKVANGDFDGHRYLFLKAQFNSGGGDQPTLTDLTISGSAAPVSPAPMLQTITT